ncbi:MAG: arginine deiminase family protein, partial [Bacteroidota bacterium]
HLPKLQEEHDVFTSILRAFLGEENVLEIADLFKEALDRDTEAKREMLEMILDWEEQPAHLVEELMKLSNTDLTQTLITGYWAAEEHVLFDPIPNFIFTRDIAVTVNDHVIVTKAAKQARFRENFLTRFVMWAHPIFSPLRESGRIINLNDINEFPPSKRGEKISIEGGDMMILNKDYLLIGDSERSTGYGLRSLADKLFQKGVIKNVARVSVPAERSFMHLDTIFTQINRHDYVCFKPIIIDGLNASVECWRADGTKADFVNLKSFLTEELDPKARFIYSGQGISPFQEREQWTDACNLVALRPGVALTYDRNPETEKAFVEAGYRIMHANDLLKAFDDGIIRPDEIRNTIITLPSSELSRGRGGSHCMTCPIERGE